MKNLLNKIKISQCFYCKKILFLKKSKFEGHYICKDCNKFVPDWTFKIRNALKEILKK